LPPTSRSGHDDDVPNPRSLPLLQATLLGDGADHAEVGIFIFDEDGNYIAANEHGAHLLGLTRKELLTHRAGDFTVGNPPPADILPESRRESAQMIRRADGRWIPVAFVVVPTRVSGLSFRISIVWELAADDPRARVAGEIRRERGV
jgi:PAS domain S-box-containing protein